MNFDDLHDPDPPRPGTATLAAVAGRARQIRRRRTALVAAGGALVAAAVVVPTALVVTGDDASERMVPATVPQSVTTAPGPTLPGPVTTLTTVPQPTVPDPTPPPPPSTTSTTSSNSSTSTTLAPVVRPTVLAVRGPEGDAVRIEPDGTETLLYDEFMPADPTVEGGDSVGVDSVAVTADGRQFVGLCCEPVAGSWFEIGAEDDVRFGHDLDVSPDGTRLVAAGASFTGVFASDGTVLASTDVSASPVYTQLEQAMWLDDDTLVLLAFQDGPTFRLLTVDVAALDDLDPMGGVVIPALPSPEAAWPELAGVGDDGSILVVQRAGNGLEYAATTLQAYDPVTFERRPGSDVTMPAPAIYARFDDGGLTWVGEDYSLHVGDAVVPGEFFWARPLS